jgi:hypothetical protein
MGQGGSRASINLVRSAVNIGGDKYIDIFSIPENNQTTTRDYLSILPDDEGGVVGLKLWPGSKVLADFLVNHRPDLVDGKTVVELGCGVGLVGLSIAKHCNPYEVILTDRESVGPVVNAGISSNGLEPEKVMFQALDWGNPADLKNFETTKPRLVVGSELIYAEEQEPLCNAIDATVDDLFVLSYSERSDSDRSYFNEKILRDRFTVVEKVGDVYILQRRH